MGAVSGGGACSFSILGGSVGAAASSGATGGSGSITGAFAISVGPGVSITSTGRGSGGAAWPRCARSACSELARLSCATRNVATTPNAMTMRLIAAATTAMTARMSGNMATPLWHRRALTMH